MSEADARDPFSSYRARLDAVGFRPSRRYGQNFLLEPALHRAVADAACVDGEAIALELGAGLGFLTRTLASRAACVIAVEIDARLARILREDFPPRDPVATGARVDIVECDALAAGDRLAEPVEAALAAARRAWPSARLCVAANLPYAIAGPLLVALAVRGGDDAVAAMGVLVQDELAERLAAPACTAEYGSLPALLQALYHVRIERRVGREVFRPRPQVDSAIVSLHARAEIAASLRDSAGRAAFARFVRALFTARRKTLRHAFDRVVPAWDAASPGLAALATRRAESLDPDALVELFRALGEPGR